MKIEVIKVGYLETNVYLLSKGGHTLIIDPGDESEKIAKHVNGIVDGIIVTHHHFDHVGALYDISNKYNSKIYDRSNLKEGNNSIGEFNFEVIYTPGHMDDLISLYFKNDKCLFCGDFIFKGSIGRYDFPESNFADMQSSIKKILNYPNDTQIYPGHGDKTTLLDEINLLKSFL